MSSSLSSIAPKTVAADTEGSFVPVARRDSFAAPVQNRFDTSHNRLTAAHVRSAQPAGTAVVRQHFYPAQLRRLLGGDLMALVASRKYRLSWIGWDRSLPRMYLPVESLQRLVLDAADGITRQAKTPASGTASINMRVEFQGIANSTLVLALDAERWQCEPELRGALNARWLRQGSQAHLWQRLARQCDTVGGWLSVANLAGGGTSLLINLPVDQPRALVQSWLSRRAARDSSRTLSLFAVGRIQSETPEALNAANIRLQSLARDVDYIYRACHGRWIWMTTESELPAFMDTAPWRYEQLDRWTFTNDYAVVLDLARRVDGRFRELMEAHVPPLDLQTYTMSRGPISARRRDTRVDQAAQVSPSNHLNARAKWRYPI